MQKTNERPVCHRAEDLVTYLYGEATAEEARDFSAHLQQCDACRAEFTVFHQVHDSIVAWRNEALGSLVQVPQVSTSAATDRFVQHERKLSALAALREFFSVSPLWLRGATAFAGLVLCALIAFAISRVWREPNQVVNTGNQSNINHQEFDTAVKKEVDARLAELARNRENDKPPTQPDSNDNDKAHVQASRRSRPKTRPANRLTREEREQLAADLGLIPGREEELPFVLPEGEEPNQ